MPIRTYYATCNVDSDEPRLFVSMSLEDTSATADPDIPTIGAVFETIYDPATGALDWTGNETTVPFCQETHGIAVSEDCSRIAVLCNTPYEEPTSETAFFTKDLVEEYGDDWIDQPNNEAAIDADSSIDPSDRADHYLYNGEVWLLEWDGVPLTADPDRYVIHKATGGISIAPITLAYAEDQDMYAAAFKSAVFDSGGGRHISAALMVIDRDGWVLNPADPARGISQRGWVWGCAGGHVFHIRAHFNPFLGLFGALCTSDHSAFWHGEVHGAIGVKMETGSPGEGYESYLVASSNVVLSNGGGHKLIPVDDEHSIMAIVGTDIVPDDDADYVAFIANAETEAINAGRSERGIEACSWFYDDICVKAFLDEWFDDRGAAYPTFERPFWNGEITQRYLSKIGMIKVSPEGEAEINGVHQNVKWLVEDSDCMLSAPQLTDLQNGRYLLGWAKFQCISDGTILRRFAGAYTLHPVAYYLMEIDADGNRVTDPIEMTDTGWGGVDEMVSLGVGRAAWAYIPNPTIDASGDYTDPYQANWNFMVYESAED